MMKDSDRDFSISDLIKKKILDEITDKELLILQTWMEEDPANLKLFNRITDEGLIREKHRTYDNISTEQALNQVHCQIKDRTLGARIRVLSILKYAAAIIIPLLFGGYFLTRYLNVESGDQIIANEIHGPGTQKALLTLANGEQIRLNQSNRQIISSRNNIQIKDTARILSYIIGEPAPEKEETISIAYNTLETPRGGEYSLILSDGTRIWLNAESKLKYPTRFQDKIREVELEGEAYFEVAENPAKPFIIHTGTLEVEVLGTSFNVMSYKDEETIETTLVEGRVRISAQQGNGVAMEITPREQAVYYRNLNTMDVREVDPAVYTAWKEGRYIIDNKSLESLMRQLGRWYDFECKYLTPETRDIRFSGTLNRYGEITRIFDLISQTTDISFEMANEGVIIISKHNN